MSCWDKTGCWDGMGCWDGTGRWDGTGSGWLLGGSTGGRVAGRRSGAREGTLPVGTNSRPLLRRSVRLRSSARRALRCSSAAFRSSLMVSSRVLRNSERVPGLRSCLCGLSFSISSKACRVTVLEVSSFSTSSSTELVETGESSLTGGCTWGDNFSASCSIPKCFSTTPFWSVTIGCGDRAV